MEAVMRSYIEILIILPLLVMCYQLYFFSVHSAGRKQQERCQKLGIVFMTLGIIALVFKSAPFAFFGLILMMFGFRLIAKGLDRLDKNIFIDQYEDDK
jgi:integral membrane sensor domain MASE1